MQRPPFSRLLPTAVLLVLLAVGSLIACAGDAPPPAWKSVPIPESEPEYRCPAQSGATILQGNNGTFSHVRHFAWDYTLPIGAPVVAARSGVVAKCRTDSNLGGDRRFEGDANEIRVRHSDGTEASYLHLAKNATLVREGEFVLQGEHIADSGNSGFSTEPHLHFEVWRNDKSVAVRFADFKSNDGVPKEGNRHGPAAPARIAQSALTAYKKLHRAALVASARAWPDLGLAILQAAPNDPAFASYYYAQVVEEHRKSMRATLDADLIALCAAPVTTFPAAMRIKRYLVTLKKVRGCEAAVDQLTLAEKTLAPELQRAFQTSGSTVSALVEGMRLECFEEIFDAGGKYLQARQSSQGLLREEALRQVRRLIDLRLDDSIDELVRLKEESERCLSEHKTVIRADADRVVKLCRSLFGYLNSWFPAEKSTSGRDIKIVDFCYDRIVRNTR